MKNVCIKVLTCILISLCLVTIVSACMPVKAAEIEPYSYYIQSFSFKGTCTIAKNVSGMWMDVKVKATANNNNNETITLEVYIENRDTRKKYTFLSDGQEHAFKGIYLGLSGGSSVGFSFTGANPAITINVDMTVTS